ncbi:hypothetical protein K432DRAFT_318862 [Lepidopterella palustris CBS 459.81]|uniref:Uncharacterized protein n=1 Tax=Lepidopterella palustris CBS 459.81 TaxID=1314670 RepID=A0A8E2EJY0_9PEZI|nr:hypothetical protein K432DRAFT_318862 [Lepidopterella palustris CBS 459.81]
MFTGFRIRRGGSGVGIRTGYVPYAAGRVLDIRTSWFSNPRRAKLVARLQDFTVDTCSLIFSEASEPRPRLVFPLPSLYSFVSVSLSLPLSLSLSLSLCLARARAQALASKNIRCD